MNYQKWNFPQYTILEEFVFKKIETFISSNPNYRGKRVFLCGGILRNKFDEYFNSEIDNYFTCSPFINKAKREEYLKKGPFKTHTFRKKIDPMYLLNIFAKISQNEGQTNQEEDALVRPLQERSEILSDDFQKEFLQREEESSESEEEGEFEETTEPELPRSGSKQGPESESGASYFSCSEMNFFLLKKSRRQKTLSHNIKMIEFGMKGIYEMRGDASDFDLVVQSEYFSDFVIEFHKFLRDHFPLGPKSKEPRIVKLRSKAVKNYRLCKIGLKNGIDIDIKEFKSKAFLSYLKQFFHCLLVFFKLRTVKHALVKSQVLKKLVCHVVFLDIFEEKVNEVLSTSKEYSAEFEQLTKSVFDFEKVETSPENLDLSNIDLLCDLILQNVFKLLISNNLGFYVILRESCKHFLNILKKKGKPEEKDLRRSFTANLLPLTNNEKLLDQGLLLKKSEIQYLIQDLNPSFYKTVSAVLSRIQTTFISSSKLRALKQDLKTRDFVINSLYYDFEEKKVYDFCRAVEDIYRKRLEVFHPSAFKDDSRRLLRTFRFAGSLEFELGGQAKKCVSSFLKDSPFDLRRSLRLPLKMEMIKIISKEKCFLIFDLLSKFGFFESVFRKGRAAWYSNGQKRKRRS